MHRNYTCIRIANPGIIAVLISLCNTGYLLECTKPRDLPVTCTQVWQGARFVGHVNLQYLMQNKQVLFGQNTKLNAIFVFSYNVREHALLPPGFTERTCFLVCQV